MAKTSKEKVMQKMGIGMANPMPDTQSKPKNRGGFDVRWEVKNVDGKNQVHMTLRDHNEIMVQGESKPETVYTDKDELKKAVDSMIDGIKETKTKEPEPEQA